MANGVTNDNGTLTLTELSAEDITSLLAGARTKGEYLQLIEDFAKTGDLYTIVNMPGREQAAIVQSLKLNLAKCSKATPTMPAIAIVKKGDSVLLVNKAAHAAAVEAAKAA